MRSNFMNSLFPDLSYSPKNDHVVFLSVEAGFVYNSSYMVAQGQAEFLRNW